MDLINDSILTPSTPTSPLVEDDKPQKGKSHLLPENEYIKIKIALNNGDDEMIALKIKRSNLISIVYLKKLISFKMYKDYNLINHYKLQVRNDEDNIESEEALFEHIKSHSKVSLGLVRSRGNSVIN